MTTQRDSFARAEAVTLAALSGLLIAVAILRRDFIGDGVRHIHLAISSSHPTFGAPRWLLFPTLAWALIHPFASTGLVSGVEPAIRVLLLSTVASGILYLYAIHVWLRAEGHDARARTAALILAASTMPFLVLYADIAEVQVAAAVVVTALAVTKARTVTGRTGDGTVLGLVAVIGAAALVYQGLIVAMAFVPLAVPLEQIRRRRVLLGWAAILLAVPLLMILARIVSGEAGGVAFETTVAGESNPAVRLSMAAATPLKWAAALLAGPPQAMVRLANFQGLSVLARDLRSDAVRGPALADVARLVGGLVLVWGMVVRIVQTRDWKLALAMLALVSLPMVRNNQYNYHKFYALWPALIALASTKFPSRQMLAVGAMVLAFNGTLLARDIATGRRLHTEMQALYQSAAPDMCFFTSGWSAPFPYLWPGTMSAVISDLWIGPDAAGKSPLTASLGRCFCTASRVWTDTTDQDRETVQRLVDQFKYGDVPVANLLYRGSDGSQVANNPSRIFVYSPARQAELCQLARDRGK